MYEGGRVQGLERTLPAALPLSLPAQFVVDEGEQALPGLLVSAGELGEKTGDLLRLRIVHGNRLWLWIVRFLLRLYKLWHFRTTQILFLGTLPPEKESDQMDFE